MSVTQLVRTYGDRDNQFHRSALAGNAMLFNAQRWVRLTAGTDTLPQLNNISIDYIVSFYATNVSGDGNANTIVSQNNTVLGIQSGRENRICILNNFLFLNRSLNATRQRRFDITGTWLNQRTLGMFQSVSDTVSKFYNRGRFVNNTSVIFAQTNNDTIPFIDIGRMSGFANTTVARFFGYIRSVEIIVGRNLIDSEIRRAFNFGTAHSAGLITTSDISIDFNVLNGQAPICRPGSRQLTVTAYNNTTADTAGTTYADFYSL